MTENNRNQITILGIGNTLYTDEGLGVNALTPLEEIFGRDEHVELIDGSTDGMGLLGPVEDTDYLIIIDAINAGKEGGHIIELHGDDIPAYYGIKMSIHQLGFQEVLLASKLREQYPKNIVMIGMQPTSLELGIGLSETNDAKLPELVKLVEEQVDKWKLEMA
ncbi:HyaD/HybD family hydrogenase maturation endopeptidase [Lysinibacillus sp. NPDC097287]|uniref:HyaD/HybD family hydrogenase maturation endopeptidase n=1 Tax=Lysinibacillus sp. NPDC097287 TaxID=3364144 RepID=UPI00380CF2D3